MSDIHPESQFITKDLAAYEGMTVEEYTFCRLKNYRGEMQDYALDLITLPEPTEAPRPVVIFVHGGGFVQPYDKRQGYIPIFAKALTKAGYAVVSPDYPIFDTREQRNEWNDSFGADRAAEAIHLAYLYIKENAERLRLDADRIAIMGGSAGGMACFYLLEHYETDIKAFGNCWGAPWKLLPDVAAFPPTVSIHGTADPLVSYELELPIQDAFKTAGIPHKLLSIEGAGHTPMKHFGTYIPTVLEWLEKHLKN